MDTGKPQFDLQWIERVVREVIKRLSQSTSEATTSGDAGSSPKQIAEAGEWKLNQRVISLEAITGKLDNINVLRLPSKAVVTPAARDELRSRNVAVRFDLSRQQNIFTGKQLMLGVTNELTGKDVAGQLNALGIQAELHHDDRISRLVANLGGRVSALRRCLVITGEPYTAVCVANRNANVRAAMVRDETELRMAQAELNPNFLVLPVERLALSKIDEIARSLIDK